LTLQFFERKRGSAGFGIGVGGVSARKEGGFVLVTWRGSTFLRRIGETRGKSTSPCVKTVQAGRRLDYRPRVGVRIGGQTACFLNTRTVSENKKNLGARANGRRITGGGRDRLKKIIFPPKRKNRRKNSIENEEREEKASILARSTPSPNPLKLDAVSRLAKKNLL